MLYPTDEEWAKWGIIEERHKFFFLRWHEIFAENTFDSWQSRSNDFTSILKEMLECTKIVEKVHPFHQNLFVLIEEAQLQIKNDSVIKQIFPFVGEYLSRLKEIYETNVKIENKCDLNQFRKIVNIILGNLDNYHLKLIRKIRDLLTGTENNYKIELYDLLNFYGTYVHLLGYSVNFIRDSLNALKLPETEPFEIRFDNLVSLFSGEKKEYNCRFFITFPYNVSQRDFQELNIYIEEKRPINPINNENLFYKQDKEALIAVIKISALDQYSARYIAEDELERLFAVTQLYDNKKTCIKHNSALVHDSKGDWIIEPDNSRLTYHKYSHNPTHNIERFINMRGNLQFDDISQITASLQHYRLFLSAPSDGSRLINLWVALEALIQDGGKSIIERITNFVPAIETVDYVNKTIRALPMDFYNFWKANDTTEVRRYLKHSDEKKVDLLDMLSVLLDEKRYENNEEKRGLRIESFLQFAAPNPLLVFRISRLWDKMFGSPNNLLIKLESHQKNVEWQLRRIYRARNYIMHTGAGSNGTRQLIQHLQSYYLSVIHSLIKDLNEHNKWSIGQVMENKTIQLKILFDSLRSYTTKPFPLSVLLDTKKILSPWPKDELSAWSVEKLKEKH